MFDDTSISKYEKKFTDKVFNKLIFNNLDDLIKQIDNLKKVKKISNDLGLGTKLRTMIHLVMVTEAKE